MLLMKKGAAIILIMFLLTACDSKNVVTKEQVEGINVKEYLPQTVGTTITTSSYKPENGKEGIKQVDKVTKIETSGERKKFYIDRCTYFVDTSIDPVCINFGDEATNKVLMSSPGEMEINTDYIQWQLKSKEFSYWISGTKKKVSTPAGDFEDCIEVTQKNNKSGIKFLFYYAKGIGKIQTYMLDGSKKTLFSELTKIEAPKNGNTSHTSAPNNNVNNKEDNETANTQSESTTKRPSSQDEPYSNGKYGFEIDLPEQWKQHISVRKGQSEQNKEESITLVYDLGKGLSSPIVTILKEKNEGDITETINKNKELGMYFLDQSPKYLYFFITPMDPSAELTQPENAKQLSDLQKVITEEVPNVMQSFKLKKTK